MLNIVNRLKLIEKLINEDTANSLTYAKELDTRTFLTEQGTKVDSASC